MRIRSASCTRERPFPDEWFRCAWPAPSHVTMEVLSTANMALQDASGGRNLPSAPVTGPYGGWFRSQRRTALFLGAAHSAPARRIQAFLVSGLGRTGLDNQGGVTVTYTNAPGHNGGL